MKVKNQFLLGFTLVELLIVISIIAVLSASGLAVFNSALKKARDSRRKADLRAIQNVMELYYMNNFTYNVYYWNLLYTYWGSSAPPSDPRNVGYYHGVGSVVSANGYTYTADLEADGNFVKTDTYTGNNDFKVSNLQ